VKYFLSENVHFKCDKKNSFLESSPQPAVTLSQKKLVKSNSIIHESFTKGIEISQANLFGFPIGL